MAMQIQTLADKCATLFEARIDAYEAQRNEFGYEDEILEVMETQNARFKLWADNIGVFAEGNASLDARLQDHGDISTLVIGQLHSVVHHLGRMATYRSNESDQDEIHAAEHAYDDNGYASSAPSESSSFSRTSETTTSPSTGLHSDVSDEDEETPPLAAIVHAVHRLHRVAMAVRRSGMASQDLKASAEQIYDADGRNVIDVFEKWCLEVLNIKFRTADEHILQRVARANAERRRRFLYRNKHQKKLMGRRESATKGRKDSTHASKSPSGPYASSVVGSASGAENSKSEVVSVTQGSNTQFSQTTASRVVREDYNYEPTLRSTMTSAAPSTQLLVDGSMYPPAPRVVAGTAEFYCRYCCRIQPAAERSGKRWKKHFLKDLSPFVCMVEQCQEQHTLFSDQQSWIKHMEQHNIQYKCQQHPKPIIFSTEAEFDQHILTEHKRLSPARLNMLRSLNSSNTRLDICSCPLCGFIPSNAPVPGASVAKHKPAYEELLAHIANDLHYIAMLSLVENDEAEADVSSNVSDLRIPDHSTQNTDDMASINLNRDSLDFDISEWRDDPLEQEIELLAVVPDDVDPSDEWYQMQEKQRSYSGHQTDTVLESFIRKVQLEKLLEEGKAADPQIPCYVLPNVQLNKKFYGRKQKLRQLEAHLHPGKATRSLQTMTLTGPAGIGKTALARQYCQTYQNQYDVILWVHADAESKMANDFVKIAIELGFVRKDSSVESREQGECRQLVRAWLANPRLNVNDEDSEKARWLLVLDHVIDPNLVNWAWPINCESGSILMTSRKPMPWSLIKYPVLPVGSFDPEDSAAFLSSLIKTENIGGGTLRLGSRALHSPAQLIFLARMIDSNRYSLDKFMQASRDENGNTVILVLHKEDATEEQTQFSEWALESLSPKAAALLDVMSMLDPDQIVERMLIQPPDDISIPNYPKTMGEYYEARNELLNVSFISRDRSTGNVNIHRLIQDAARANMSEEYYRNVFNTCVTLINDEWPYQTFTWRHGISRWPKCEELYPHIIRLEHFSARVPAREDNINGAYGYARLATDVLWYCHERGRFSESEGLCNASLDRCLVLRELLEKDPHLSKILNTTHLDRTIAETHHNRGCIAAEMNRPKEALEHQLVFNRMMLRELEENMSNDMRLSMSFNELGVAYMINDEWAEGERCFKRSIEEMERMDNFKRYKISLPLVNLAYCHSLSKRYTEAEELFLLGLTDRIEEFGENDTESFITGRFYQGLANVKLGQGMEQESFEYLEKAKEHYRLTLGRGHHRSADVAVALGRHYSHVADDKTAIEYFSKALDAYGDRSIYNPERTRALFNRAKSYRRLGLAVEARVDEDASLTLYRKLAPHDFRPLNQLEDTDFDKLIVFWSR